MKLVNAALDRTDLLNLLKGLTESIKLGTESKAGEHEGGGFNDPVWEWNTDYLEKCTDLNLYELYLKMKKEDCY